MSKPNIAAIVAAHRARALSAVTSIPWGGTTHQIEGRSANIMTVGVTAVELLAPESTPQEMLLAQEAEYGFGLAALNLLERGEPFYTVLRDGWALPAFLWERESACLD